MKPLALDLFCGLGGWAEGLLDCGYEVIGYDIERHVYGTQFYPGVLIQQSVLDLHGAMFRHFDLIVASPPCQEFSYMAMPWKRGKQAARAFRGEDDFPASWSGSRTIADLTRLFDACFRIQREACEAAGRHIPMVVENVRGAQPWVGRASWNYGSFYLWGDVPAIMPFARRRKSQHSPLVKTPPGTGNTSWFFGNSKHEGRHGADEVGNKSGGSWFGDYQAQKEKRQEGIKNGGDWFSTGLGCGRHFSSRSQARKAASAQIAKIPYALARWVGSVYLPARQERAA